MSRHLFSTLTAVILGASLVSGSGCQSQLSRVKQDNARLDQQLIVLRAEKRRNERHTRELENELFTLRERSDTASVKHDRVGDAPTLPVEVLGPSAPIDEPITQTASGDDYGNDYGDAGDGARVVGVLEDGTEIVYADDAARGSTAASGNQLGTPSGSIGGDDLDLGFDDAKPAPAKKPRAKPAAKEPAPAKAKKVAAEQQYRDAVERLRTGDHEGAITDLRAFVAQYPHHEFADNAQYWLGEAYYDLKDFPRALTEFRAAVERYPDGNKVPDALLKMGYSYLAMGQADKARAVLEEVLSVYPKSEPAQLAGKRLEAIEK